MELTPESTAMFMLGFSFLTGTVAPKIVGLIVHKYKINESDARFAVAVTFSVVIGALIAVVTHGVSLTFASLQDIIASATSVFTVSQIVYQKWMKSDKNDAKFMPIKPMETSAEMDDVTSAFKNPHINDNITSVSYGTPESFERGNNGIDHDVDAKDAPKLG